MSQGIFGLINFNGDIDSPNDLADKMGAFLQKDEDKKIVAFKILLAFFTSALLFLFLGNQTAFSQSFPRGQLIFIDSFESGQLEDRWHVDNRDTTKINYNPLNVHFGSRSMEVIALPGKEAGGGGRIFFMPGYDKVHVRWYCKFDSDFDQGDLMHLNKLVAVKEKWASTADRRPNGFDFFRTTLDVWRDWGRNPPPGEPVLGSYFPLMKSDRDGKYYGNLFKAERKVLIEKGRWYCMEMMLKANDPGFSNGEQAFWINGELFGHFKNMIWRFTRDLKMNSFGIGLYIHENKKINRIWYDDVIISTGFIGLY
jgi:hypothetical protein